MPQLQRLYIAYNKLTSLPDCIGEITALNDIWLRGNSIATIPDSFCKLRQHISGYMMMAGIQHLPDCIGDVPFSFLYLYGNELSELPDSMQQIYAAHDGFELSLADNQLTALPAWVATTPQIGSINVEGNRLTSLPTALPPHLTSLRLGGNPIVNVTNAALVSLLQAAPDLDTFSLRYAPPGLTHNPGWMDPNSYVVKTMPTAGDLPKQPRPARRRQLPLHHPCAAATTPRWSGGGRRLLSLLWSLVSSDLGMRGQRQRVSVRIQTSSPAAGWSCTTASTARSRRAAAPASTTPHPCPPTACRSPTTTTAATPGSSTATPSAPRPPPASGSSNAPRTAPPTRRWWRW